MSGYLMDKLVDRERVYALSAMCKAYVVNFFLMWLDFNGRYRPSLDVRFVADELGFEGDQDCIEFLRMHNVHLQLTDGKLKFDTKAAFPAFEALKSSLTKVDLKGQL
jgi:hypothetical protein